MAIVIQVTDLNHWLSEEQAQQIIDKAADTVTVMVNQLGQGRKLKIGM